MLNRLESDLKEQKGAAPKTIDANLKTVFIQILEKSQEILQYTFECLINSELDQLDQEARKIPGVQKMLLICENDKERFIKLLDILDFTYFGNVLSLTRIDDLFKKLADTEKAANEKDKAPVEDKTAKVNENKVIDTSAAKKPTEAAAAADQPLISSPQLTQGSSVQINMIKSLVKLLKRNQSSPASVAASSEVEQSSFANEKEFA